MLLKLIARAFSARSSIDLDDAYALLERDDLESARARAAELCRRAPHAEKVRLFAANVACREEQYSRAADLLRESEKEALPYLRRALYGEFAAESSPASRNDAQLLCALVERVWSAPPDLWQRRLESFAQYGWLLHSWHGLNEISAPLIERLFRLDPAAL